MKALRWLVLALSCGLAGCASSGAVGPVPRPFPGAPVPGAVPAAPAPGATTAAVPARVDVTAVVKTALGFRGVPYRNGGSDPSGFDCSGLVQYVFAQHGIALPREVQEQYALGTSVKLANVRVGDLVFFSTEARGPSHVGMVVAGDEFVHAPSTRGVVRVEHFGSGYWANRVVGVRRLR